MHLIGRRGARLGTALILGVALIGTSLSASAQESVTVTGVTDYEARPPGDIVESIAVNQVTMTFNPAGGPFSGSVRLELVHDVPARGCQFKSTHTWEFSGDFDASTGQFTGTWVETRDTTTGACDNFNFIRDFDPQEDSFRASLIAQLGRIQGRVSAATFTLEVDPSLFETEPPTPLDPSDVTTNPDATSPTGPQTTPDQPPGPSDIATEGIPPWVWLVVLAVLLGIGVTLRQRFRSPGDTGEPDEEEVDDCSDLERRWREARDACRDAQRRSKELSDRFDEADERLSRAEQERASLPSDKTRVELPDGTTLSQLDLELRRSAAQGAWDEYMANPSPEAAAAAEKAWQEQATPEWLEQQRQEHQARKDSLDRDVDDARSEKDQVSKDLSEARSSERDLCKKAGDLEKELEACRDAVKRAAAEPQPPPTPPEPATPPTPPAQPEPPSSSPTPPTAPRPPSSSDDAEDESCKEGEERWRDVDGPHPFTISPDEMVKITLRVKSGTQIRDRLGSLDQAGVAQLDRSGKASAITFNLFVGMSGEEIRGAFSGKGGLAEFWATHGAGAEQTMTLTLTYTKRTVMAYCQQKEVCISGTWQPQPKWRTKLKDPRDEVVDKPSISVSGNLDAGFGRAEDTYLDEIASIIRQRQIEVRSLISNKERLDEYRKECKAGGR